MQIIIKTIIIIIFTPMLCVSQKKTVITFDSNESTSKVALLAICESLISTKVEYLSAGKSKIYLDIDAPTNINFSINKKYRPIYIYPGDSLAIIKHEDNIVFKGNRANEWNYMSNLSKNGYELIGNGWNINTTDINKLLSEAKGKKDIILNEISKVKDSLKFSSEYIYLLKRDVEFSFLRSIIQQHNKNTITDRNASEAIYKYLLGFDKIFKSESLRNSYVFNFSLMSWSTFLARRETGFGPPKLSKTYNPDLKEDFAENFDLRIEMAKKMPEPMRSEIMYKLISFRFINNSWEEDYIPYVNAFNEISTAPTLVEHINVLAGKSYTPPRAEVQKSMSSGDQVSETKLLDADQKSISWKDVLQANRGKVIYVDVWASWCGPCIKAIRESHQFDKFIEAQRDKLAVVHLSIDENLDLWRKAMHTHGIEKRQNYHMNLDSGLGDLVVPDKTIPRYFVIDRHGKLLTDKAPSVGSRAFLDLMKKLIDEK